jgi:4-hydroxybenzoate polyprenyltransferase/phosphoserine phosphatase
MPDSSPSILALSIDRSAGIEPPLCVDLDGTLIKSDLLFECLAAMTRKAPLSLLLVPIWALRGRAFLKHELASRGSVDAKTLPYNGELLAWLLLEREAGRRIVLATAATQGLADAVSNYLGFFDLVIASTTTNNCKGIRKLDEIRARVGDVFDYVGDSRADAPIFRASRQAICVAPAISFDKTVDRGHSDIQFRFVVPAKNAARLFLTELRIHQWIKNLLVFIPLASAHKLMDLPLSLKAFICFLAFNCVASSVYVINDIVDIEADRNHAHKRRRPLAAGSLSLRVAFFTAPILLTLGVFAGFWLGTGCGLVLLGYFISALLYTFILKTKVLYDVFTLAILYTFRLVAGQEAYSVPLSTWLVSCCFFLFQSLAFCKRASELADPGMNHDQEQNRRGYLASDATIVSMFGIGSGMLASLITVLYVESENVRKLYHHPQILWLLSPLILQWVARTWMLAHRGLIKEDPVMFSIKDNITWITLAVGVLLIAAASI